MCDHLTDQNSVPPKIPISLITQRGNECPLQLNERFGEFHISSERQPEGMMALTKTEQRVKVQYRIEYENRKLEQQKMGGVANTETINKADTIGDCLRHHDPFQ
jgi:hypothetical protein